MIIFLLILIIVLLSIAVGLMARLVFYTEKTITEYMEFTHNGVVKKLEEIQGEVKKRGHVTPPIVAANKTHTPGASSKHIIIRKTPDQIRAENAEEIRKGAASYGQPTE